MKSIRPATVKQILSLLASGHSTKSIAAMTCVSAGTVSNVHSQHCSALPKSTGGHPSKLSENDLRHTVHAITTGRVDMAVQAKKQLVEITNMIISVDTVRRGLKKVGFKAVVKVKKP